jgi:uncharacterized protein
MGDDHTVSEGHSQNPSRAASNRLHSLSAEPLFIGNWMEVVMIHYEVDPGELQTLVPFELDLWNGRAFISLVAFRLTGMRPRWGGRVLAGLFRTEDFLNVRTYVVQSGEPGIFFLAEWLSGRLSVAFGPLLFGLPYRPGYLAYDHGRSARAETPGGLRGRVVPSKGAGQLLYRGTAIGTEYRECESRSLEEWLMERYTAFTGVGGRRRFFRVFHAPWKQVKAQIEVVDNSLLLANWRFFERGKLVGANFSPGLTDVSMGWPHWIAKDRRLGMSRSRTSRGRLLDKRRMELGSEVDPRGYRVKNG